MAIPPFLGGIIFHILKVYPDSSVPSCLVEMPSLAVFHIQAALCFY